MITADKVRYVGDEHVTTGQVRWGSNCDPRGLLHPNIDYLVDSVEIHSCHTKIYLKDFPGKPFNSIHFKEVKDEE